MQKATIIISLSVLLLLASAGQPAASAPDPRKQRLHDLRQQQKQQKKQMQQQYDQGNMQPPEQGRMDSRSQDNGGGGGESISMFKAGNTSLPAGTYAMTNVSTGAAFVVIVDDTGDMRAQDARAMKLIDDSKIGSDDHHGGGDGNDYGGGNNSYGGGSSYGGNSYGGGSNSYGGGYSNNQPYNEAAAGKAPLLPPQSVPSSAVLPTPNASQHPLLQGMSSQSMQTQGMPQPPKQGGLQGLMNQLNPQSPAGRTLGANSGISGKIQAELTRQLSKHVLKGGTGGIEKQVRKMIKSF